MEKVARLTDQHLLKTIANFPENIRSDRSLRSYFLCLAIVKYFFSENWVEEHIAPNGGPGFLRQESDDRTRSEIQSFRIVDLAELLFNLQHVDGFDDCIDRMRHGIIESTYAELDLGRMLYISDVVFRFVKPQGIKGNDYDIEITMPDGVKVCADAKCKIEATSFSTDTVRQTLDKARRQFPPDRPSIIFVKIPPQWGFLGLPIGELLESVGKGFLRGTGRIVSVKFYASLTEWKDGIVMHLQNFREMNNVRNRFDANRNWDMFAQPKNSTPTNNEEFSDVPERWRRLLSYPQGILR